MRYTLHGRRLSRAVLLFGWLAGIPARLFAQG